MPEIPGRLMLRAEGDWWNAYFGKSTEDRIHIGSIRIAIVTKSPTAKQAFMECMSNVVAEAVREIYGENPEMHVSNAPESERAGSA